MPSGVVVHGVRMSQRDRAFVEKAGRGAPSKQTDRKRREKKKGGIATRELRKPTSCHKAGGAPGWVMG